MNVIVAGTGITTISPSVCAAAEKRNIVSVRVNDIAAMEHSYLSIYGTVDNRRQVKAAQIMYRPEPIEIEIPSGIDVRATTRALMGLTLLMATVHIDAPIRSKRLPRMAKQVDTRNATVCLTRPLEWRDIHLAWHEQESTMERKLTQRGLVLHTVCPEVTSSKRLVKRSRGMNYFGIPCPDRWHRYIGNNWCSCQR